MKQSLDMATIALCLVVSACASRGTQGSAGGVVPEQPQTRDPTHQHEPVQPAAPGPGVNAADVQFMQHMIGHHAQALLMTAMVVTHGAGQHLRDLGEKIDISQRDEIAFMKRWLEQRGQSVPDAGHMQHDLRMPGMLTADQLAQLDAARGRDFERLFLSFMIQHHRGALEMVEALFDSPGAGQDSEIFRFATDVDADQRDEIYVMQGMLNMLDSQGSQFR